VRGLKGKVRALEARATEQAARLTQMDGQLDADRGTPPPPSLPPILPILPSPPPNPPPPRGMRLWFPRGGGVDALPRHGSTDAGGKGDITTRIYGTASEAKSPEDTEGNIGECL